MHLQVLESELVSENAALNGALENNNDKMLLCVAKGNVCHHLTRR